MKHELTNDTLATMHTALTILGNRRMASAAADLKIARLINAFRPHAEPIAPARQRIVRDATDGVNLAALSRFEADALGAKIATAHAALNDATVVIDIPDVRISPADLPKEQPGENGWQNAAQLGAIVADLGLLFEFPQG